MSPPAKRLRLSEPEDRNGQSSNASQNEQDDESDASEGLSVNESDSEAESGNSEGIENLKPQKSQQTKKRKIRASGTTAFGATLQSLLSTDAPSALPLSLKPSISRKRNDEKLEIRAKKVLQVERKEKEDKGHIADVIGGWGGESERALRKVAQRGVVKLFNAIQQTQASASAVAEEHKANRGTGKPTLPAPVMDDNKSRKSKKKDNMLGRAKESTVNKDDFFDMIRGGGIVSKA